MKTLSAIFALIFTIPAASQVTAAPPASQPAPVAAPRQHEPIKPIPLQVNLDARKVALGKALFHEPMLSHDNTISCASCHDLGKGGTDRRPVSIGIRQTKGELNSPTVFNSAGNFKQFWDGRAATLEEQIDGPIHSPAEMGSNWEEIIAKLRASPTYAAQFGRIYSDGLQAKNIRDAIAVFERSLITPNSRFDKFLRGDETALSADEREGYRKFKSYGCANCHQGVNIGGNLFETMGAMVGYFEERGGVSKADLGRYNVTGDEEDRFVFKVPSLRNIALTGPYLHDGSAKTLEKVVTLMARYQLGQHVPSEDVDKIVKFLETLTGEFEGKPL
jgi:cytochrome c peroxidase